MQDTFDVMFPVDVSVGRNRELRTRRNGTRNSVSDYYTHSLRDNIIFDKGASPAGRYRI